MRNVGYIYDPNKNDFSGFIKNGERLEVIEKIDNWVSPRLGIRFQLAEPELIIYYADGQPFSSYIDERKRAENEKQRAEKLAATLRELGINPEEIELPALKM